MIDLEEVALDDDDHDHGDDDDDGDEDDQADHFQSGAICLEEVALDYESSCVTYK